MFYLGDQPWNELESEIVEGNQAETSQTESTLAPDVGPAKRRRDAAKITISPSEQSSGD